MAGPIAIDTPDYQRGIVSAQKLLATVPAGTNTVIVGLPPNVETLVVFPNFPVAFAAIRVEGVTTGFPYPGVTATPQTGLISSNAYYFDVSPGLDESVQITIPAGGVTPWYVVADSASRITLTANMSTSVSGAQYVIPSVPSTLAGDHPPVELSYLGAYLNATGDVLAAPGAGQRLRVFAAQMGAQTAGVVGGLRNGSAGEWFATCGASGDSHVAFPLTGLPLPANESVNYQLVAGAGFMLITVAYTVEII